MTGTELYNLATGLNGDVPIDEDIFYPLLNMKKGQREMERDWMKLRAFDSSQSFTSADDYLSTKPLPARFLRTYDFVNPRTGEYTGVAIIDAQGRKHPLRPIFMEERYEHRDTNGFFYIDTANDAIGRTGTLAGTLHLYFLQGTVDIDADNEWVFPDFSHPLLAYDVVVENKGGIDWDTVNANQVPFNRTTVQSLESSLNMWDARLQQAAVGV